MLRKKTKRQLFASEIAYLDPMNCNSTVGFTVKRGRRGQMYATVELADCNRKIEWYFENNAGSVAKIDKAITLLVRFRHEFIARQTRRKK